MRKVKILQNQTVSLGILFLLRTTFGVIAGLVVPILVIKSIGLAKYGEFIFLSTLSLVLLIVSELGINGVFLRNALHLEKEQAKEYLWKAFLLRVLTFIPFALISIVGVVIFNHFHPLPNLVAKLLWVILSTFFLTLQGMFYLTNLGLRRNYPQMASEFASRLVWIVGAYFGAKYYGVSGLLAVTTLATFLQVLIGGAGLVKYSLTKNYTFKEIWDSSRHFGVNTILMGLLNKVDILVIGIFFGGAYTGAYGYGSRIRDFFIDFVGTATSSYFKKFKSEERNMVVKLQKILAYLAALLGFLGLPFALLVGSILKEHNPREVILSITFFSFLGVIIVLNQNILWDLTAKNLVKELNQATLYNTIAKTILIILTGFTLGFPGLLLGLFFAEILYLLSLTQILKDKHNYDYLLVYLPLALLTLPLLLAYKFGLLPLFVATVIILLILYALRERIKSYF